MFTAQRSLALSILLITGTFNVYGMNLTRLYDIPLKPSYHADTKFQLSGLAEGGISNRSYNTDAQCANVLRIWNPDQDALAMLKGFGPCSPITELLDEINAIDNGVRGHLAPCADLDLRYSLSLAARYFFNHNLSLAAYLPVYSMRLSNVSWCDLTQDITEQDLLVKELLTSKLGAITQEFGCLDIGGWQRTGVGDLALLLEWVQNFKQAKPFLKNVSLGWRAGLSLPSGLKKDEDKLFAVPFGYDGAVGLIFGGGLNVDLGDYFNAGFDVELLQLFGSERSRRIKTDPSQTDLLLLQKATAYKDWGLTQRFNLFMEADNFFKGLSVYVDYQFLKHGDDLIAVAGSNVSSTIASTAISLEEWTAHVVTGKIGYDFGYNRCDSQPISSRFWVYARVPCNGKRSSMFSSAGIIASLEF